MPTYLTNLTRPLKLRQGKTIELKFLHLKKLSHVKTLNKILNLKLNNLTFSIINIIRLLLHCIISF